MSQAGQSCLGGGLDACATFIMEAGLAKGPEAVVAKAKALLSGACSMVTPRPCADKSPECRQRIARVCDASGTLAQNAGHLKQALGYHDIACMLKLAMGCVHSGILRLDERLGTKDLAAARHLFNRACELNNPEGCARLKQLETVTGGVHKTLQNEAARLETECREKRPESCLALANAYRRGDGVPKDPARVDQALAWACEAKSDEGCRDLGIGYFFGGDHPKDVPKALGIFKMGCDADGAQSCRWYGEILAKGMDVPKNQAEGKKALEKGCRLKNNDACVTLQSL